MHGQKEGPSQKDPMRVSYQVGSSFRATTEPGVPSPDRTPGADTKVCKEWRVDQDGSGPINISNQVSFSSPVRTPSANLNRSRTSSERGLPILPFVKSYDGDEVRSNSSHKKIDQSDIIERENVINFCEIGTDTKPSSRRNSKGNSVRFTLDGSTEKKTILDRLKHDEAFSTGKGRAMNRVSEAEGISSGIRVVSPEGSQRSIISREKGNLGMFLRVASFKCGKS
jgi:hypothetical protein